MQIQRPILSEEQMWFRNKYQKNWGALKVYYFIKGQPFIIYGSLKCSVIILLLIFLNTLFLILKENVSIFFIMLSLILGLFIIFSFGFLFTCNPGVCSNSLPILNEKQMISYKGYCINCHIMKQMKIQHCNSCKLCLNEIYYHSSMLSICITKQNIKYFLFYWFSILVYSIINIILYVITRIQN